MLQEEKSSIKQVRLCPFSVCWSIIDFVYVFFADIIQVSVEAISLSLHLLNADFIIESTKRRSGYFFFRFDVVGCSSVIVENHLAMISIFLCFNLCLYSAACRRKDFPKQVLECFTSHTSLDRCRAERALSWSMFHEHISDHRHHQCCSLAVVFMFVFVVVVVVFVVVVVLIYFSFFIFSFAMTFQEVDQ